MLAVLFAKRKVILRRCGQVMLAMEHQPVPEAQPQHSHTPAPTLGGAAVPVPENLESHFFIRFVSMELLQEPMRL